jgi:hypothetical protein
MENNKQEDMEMGRKIDAGGAHGTQDTDTRTAQADATPRSTTPN